MSGKYVAAWAENNIVLIMGRQEPLCLSCGFEPCVKWYRFAAEQGLAKAQFNLGVMYKTGRGVPHDYKSAYIWFSIAGSNGVEGARQNRDWAAKQLTPQKLSQAQREAAALFEKLKAM